MAPHHSHVSPGLAWNVTWFALAVMCSCSPAAFAMPPEKPGSGPEQPAIVILELDGTNKLTLSNVTNPDVTTFLSVENRGKKQLKHLSIIVSRFSASTGELADAKISPADADVPVGGITQFQVSTKLLSAATFNSYGQILQGAKRLLTFKIEVVRARAKPPVDVGDIAAIQETTCFLHSSVDVPLTIKLYETGGPTRLSPPTLHSATRKPKSDSPVGEATVAKLDISRVPAPIDVAATGPQDIEPHVTEIRTPGRYDLKLRFVTSGYDPIDKDATIFLRDPWYVAFGWIALGVLVSLAVHAYSRTIRPRMLLENRVAKVLEDLRSLEASAKTKRGVEVASSLASAIKSQWNDARSRRATLAPQIDVYEQVVAALQIWDDLYGKTLKVRPRPVQEKLIGTLESAVTSFLDVPLDPSKVAASISTLKGFQSTTRSEIETELKNQLSALDTELRNDARPTAARLRASFELVAGKLSRGQIEAAVGSFDAARLQYAMMLADDLRARVASQTPPAGIPDADWRDLRTETEKAVSPVESAKDADEAMLVIQQAMKQYLYRVVASLRAAANSLGDPKKSQPVTDELDKVESSITDNKMTVAWQHLDLAHKAYSAAVIPTGRPMGAAEKLSVDALAAVASGGAVGGGAFDILDVFDLVPSSEYLDMPMAAGRIQSRLDRYDVLVSILVLLIAILTGLQVLWMDNPTWGGWGSYLAAFAWGFALDQFTFAGVAALRR